MHVSVRVHSHITFHVLFPSPPMMSLMKKERVAQEVWFLSAYYYQCRYFQASKQPREVVFDLPTDIGIAIIEDYTHAQKETCILDSTLYAQEIILDFLQQQTSMSQKRERSSRVQIHNHIARALVWAILPEKWTYVKTPHGYDWNVYAFG